MIVFCLEDFKSEIEQLRRKNAYRGIEEDLINHFFDKSIDHLKSGSRLNNSETTPYIKKRINGSGGYRVYYLLIIKDEKLYLIYIHPKTGPLAGSNLTNEAKTDFYKDALAAIKENDLYLVTASEDKKSLKFKRTNEQA